MKEEASLTANDHLQLLLDRYSLASEESAILPVEIEMANYEALAKARPRNGYIYGELTQHGLVHLKSSHEKTQHTRAEALIIGKEAVSAHFYYLDRKDPEHTLDIWFDSSPSIPLDHTGDTLRLLTLDEVTEGKSDKEIEIIQERYERITSALSLFARTLSQYDALHQTIAVRSPEVAENLKPLNPYAGELLGPRINAEEMRHAGVEFHPGVVEALSNAPRLTIIE